MADEQGSVLAGRYELLSQLGRGAMGVVWRARDRQTGQVVAVKVLLATALDDPEIRKRFDREADLAARIESRRVVRVLGHGIDGDRPFIVMELVEGHSLREVMIAHGAYSWLEIRPFLLTIARALADAHAEGVIHRDVKPTNILVTADGSVKLADFGIARSFDQTRLTSASVTVGTPAYLAPEGSRDQRSDLYALGIIAYEMLAGSPPFTGDTPQDVLLAHLRSEPDLSKVPAEARPVIGWLLAKDAARRPQSAEALIAALQTGSTATVVMPQAGGGGSSRARRNGVLIGGLAVILLLAATVVVGSGMLNGAQAKATATASTVAGAATATPASGSATPTAALGGSTASGASQTPTVPPTATPAAGPSGASSLYVADWSGGLNSSGWTGTADWSVQAGHLVSDGTGDFRLPNANPPVTLTTKDYAVEADMHVTGGCGSFGLIARAVAGGGGFAAGYLCGDKSLELNTIGRWDQYENHGYNGPLVSKAFTPNDWFKLRLEVLGKEVSIYVDGQLQIDYKYDDNTNLDIGAVGIWSEKTQLEVRSFTVMSVVPVPLSAPTPAPTSYTADWSGGLNSSGWVGTADWSVQAGQLVSDGTGGFRLPNANPPVIPNTRDYAVEADMHVTGGCGSFGLIARSDGGGGGFAAGYMCGDKNLELNTLARWDQYENHGYNGPLASKSFAPSGWFKLRLEVQGKEVRIYVNGLLQIDYKYDDNSNLNPGAIGLWAEKTQLEVRSFTVTALT